MRLSGGQRMNTIQVVLHDKNVFEGSIIIKEVAYGNVGRSDDLPNTNVLYNGTNDDRKYGRRYDYERKRGIKMSAGECIKQIKNGQFIPDKNNTIFITVNNSLGKITKINQLSDIPRDAIRTLTTTNVSRPKRTSLHWELLYLIHYALNKHSFPFVTRKFVHIHYEFRYNYDLWIVENGDLTWKLVKVSIAPINLDVSYETYEFTLPMLENFECPEGLIHSSHSVMWRRGSKKEFDSFIGSSDIAFTCCNTDTPENIQNESSIRIVNGWIRSECSKNIRIRLPQIIQQIVKSCFLSLPLAELITEYTLFNLEN